MYSNIIYTVSTKLYLVKTTNTQNIMNYALVLSIRKVFYIHKTVCSCSQSQCNPVSYGIIIESFKLYDIGNY